MIEYMPRESPIHRLNPLAKMTWAFAVMILALIFNQIDYLLVILGTVLIVAVLAGIYREMLGVLKGLLMFAVFLVVLQVLFYRQGTVLFFLLPLDYLPVTREALLLGVAMSLRMMTVLLSFVVFLATTQFKDMVVALTDKLKLPYDYVFMFMTALRFVPVFLNEIVKVREAQAARGCQVDGHHPIVKVKAYTQVAVPLVLISLRKAEGLAIAMETRGYGSNQRTYFKEQPITRIDRVVMMAIGLFVVAGVIIRLQGFGMI